MKEQDPELYQPMLKSYLTTVMDDYLLTKMKSTCEELLGPKKTTIFSIRRWYLDQR